MHTSKVNAKKKPSPESQYDYSILHIVLEVGVLCKCELPIHGRQLKEDIQKVIHSVWCCYHPAAIATGWRMYSLLV